jgi:caa(3)-type oxidase subunit IV
MDRRAIVLRPLLTAAALLACGVLSLGYALLPGAPWKLGVSLGLVLVQAGLVGGVFMALGRASALVRMTVVVGIVWLSFLFLLASTDFATR